MQVVRPVLVEFFFFFIRIIFVFLSGEPWRDRLEGSWGNERRTRCREREKAEKIDVQMKEARTYK